MHVTHRRSLLVWRNVQKLFLSVSQKTSISAEGRSIWGIGDVPHFWAGPRILVQNLCKFQNFGNNLKQILDFRVIFEKKPCTLRWFRGKQFLKFLSNNPINLLKVLDFWAYISCLEPRFLGLILVKRHVHCSPPPPPPHTHTRVFFSRSWNVFQTLSYAGPGIHHSSRFFSFTPYLWVKGH